MATFADVTKYLVSNFGAKKTELGLRLLAPLPNGRTHLVLVFDYDGYAIVAGRVADKLKNLDKICREVFFSKVGGIRVFENDVWLSESVPLEDLDESEIKVAIIGVAIIADELEIQFQGGDEF